ncbi:radical SAM family heme chaperone HemW [Thorsellia kenyensis]|uniref:Heme chaperone HemW n=1 Tax=Thorsellia kenyensis TaxID=1549888 RepID=A0ABV6CD11_9GAMM
MTLTNIHNQIQLPPLSLYIHIPWCIEKCPYCDFNSHTFKSKLPEEDYIDHLLLDLKQSLPLIYNREIKTVFIGGGTPSLLSEASMQKLLSGIKTIVNISPDAEITMEANPNSVEADKFLSFNQSGVNRLSIGVQSFHPDKLKRLGRVHNQEEAIAAAHIASRVPFQSFNLDIMHGLPNQSLDEAMADLDQMIQLNPPHFSWYQLTIEPNTNFASKPPQLPEDDLLWEIYIKGHEKLTQAGYIQYETSAYAKQGYQCAHNLNYWRFGDYIGIGCGAHGKITHLDGTIERIQKIKHPKGYMAGTYLDKSWLVANEERPFEFFMNRFRLFEPTPKAEFETFTGLTLCAIESSITEAIKKEFITENLTHWKITDKGKLFLNDLLGLFI